jgi:hypothetical protein
MINVHVLTFSGTRPKWLEQCVKSIEAEGLTPHVVAGVEGNVGAGREQAYRLGESEFVAYVDSDDYLLPGVGATCLRGLEKYRHVVTLERRRCGDLIGGRFWPGHHFTVYRRADVLPLLSVLPDHPIHCDQILVRKLCPRQLSFVGYIWRMHAGQGHRRGTLLQHRAMEAAICK